MRAVTVPIALLVLQRGERRWHREPPWAPGQWGSLSQGRRPQGLCKVTRGKAALSCGCICLRVNHPISEVQPIPLEHMLPPQSEIRLQVPQCRQCPALTSFPKIPPNLKLTKSFSHSHLAKQCKLLPKIDLGGHSHNNGAVCVDGGMMG